MRYLFYFYALVGMGLVISHPTHARPVSYAGGTTVMLMNDSDLNSAHIHYSPTAKTSIGYKFEYWHDRDFTLNAVQMNNLLKRWNKKDSQANIYLRSGVGVATQDGEQDATGFTGFSADWENRRFFTSYQNRYTEAGDIDDFYAQSARVGIAPYIGNYGDLHTWLMLQVDHSPESADTLTVTPLIRLFKSVHLLEAGVNTRGEALFNYVLRY